MNEVNAKHNYWSRLHTISLLVQISISAAMMISSFMQISRYTYIPLVLLWTAGMLTTYLVSRQLDKARREVTSFHLREFRQMCDRSEIAWDCAYFSHSAILKCAVNPAADCAECQFYERKD